MTNEMRQIAHLLPERAHKILRFLSLIATRLIVYDATCFFNQRFINGGQIYQHSVHNKRVV